MAKKESYPVFNAIFYTILAVSVYSIYSTYTSKKPSSPEPVVAKAAPAKVNQSSTPAKVKPELTEEQKKQKDFDAERTARGYVLEAAIRKSAFDPDALKIKGPQYYKNGVCVQANGKNRFGGYVGWQEYCYIIENGVWKYSGPS